MNLIEIIRDISDSVIKSSFFNYSACKLSLFLLDDIKKWLKEQDKTFEDFSNGTLLYIEQSNWAWNHFEQFKLEPYSVGDIRSAYYIVNCEESWHTDRIKEMQYSDFFDREYKDHHKNRLDNEKFNIGRFDFVLPNIYFQNIETEDWLKTHGKTFKDLPRDLYNQIEKWFNLPEKNIYTLNEIVNFQTLAKFG